MVQYTGLEIAVIGMAGRFPGADDLEGFWENLKQGVESVSFFTDEELLAEGERQEDIDDPLFVRAHAWLQGKEYFDAGFFGYLPAEANLLDPQVRIFHECVWAALEDAGCNIKDSRNKIGLFAGASDNVNWQVVANLENRNERVDNFLAFQLACARFLATRIAYFMNLKGPAVFIDTACSTSLVAIHQACKSLLVGDCNIAIAGGVTVTQKSRRGYKYREGMILSKDGHCRSFDADASGTIGGEGAGAVVLKTMKNALRDGDHIWAIIKGSGVNNDGNNKVGYTAPSINGQTEAILTAQKWAKVPPESIGMIEAHGTATALGDPIEVDALNRAFGNSDHKYCALGSVKTNIGHLDVAAGIAGFIKAVLSVRNRQLPPGLHFKTANPAINFAAGPFYVNTSLRSWHHEQYPLRAGVSSFGIGGTNAHVIVEEAPVAPVSSASRTNQLLLLSAKTPAALSRNITNLHQYLLQHQEQSLADIAYTLQTGRLAFGYRLSLVCSDRQEAIALLSAAADNSKTIAVPNSGKPLVVFMFPGQGSQYVNMCKGLYEQEPVFRSVVDECLELVQQAGGPDLGAVLFSNGEHSEIDNTAFAQPLLFIIEYALARLLQSWGIQPGAMIGHSIGEYVAACMSGVFCLQDALWLVLRRGQIMQQAVRGQMLSISITQQQLLPLLRQTPDLSLAAVNTSALSVVSGSAAAIGAFKEVLEKLGYQSRVIRTSHAFHSHLMDEVLQAFEAEVKKVTIRPQQLPFISNITGEYVTDARLAEPGYWVRHLRDTVRFNDGIGELMKNKEVLFIEAGPGRSLGTFVRSHEQRSKSHRVVNLVRPATDGSTDSRFLLTALGEIWSGGVEPDWTGYYGNEQRRKVSLPTYSFEKVAYPVNVDAYKMISSMIASAPPVKEAAISKWFYTPAWKLLPLHRAADMQTEKNGCTLIFTDECGIGDGLAEILRSKGEQVICVSAGNGFQEISPGAIYTLNASQETGYSSLFASLADKGLSPRCIIHGWNITPEMDKEFSAKNSTVYFHSLVSVIKEWPVTNDRQLVVITNDLHPVLDKNCIVPVKSLAPGLLKVMLQEYQDISTAHVDISLVEEKNNDLFNGLYKEIQVREKGKVVSLRHGRRWLQSYERLAAIEMPTQSILRTGGVYLITGGLGAVGFALSAYLLSTQSARLILLGRTNLPLREEWDRYLGDEKAAKDIKQKIQRLLELEKEGGQVKYHACDIANTEELAALVSQAEQQYGSINGVIHAAGIPGGSSINTIDELTQQDFKDQFLPKILGLESLRAVIGKKELDFCVLTSSLSAVLGGAGFGAYAPANNYMDYYLQYYKSQGQLQGWISVNFDGLQVERSSPDAINKEELWEVFNRVIGLGELPQIIVSASDLQKRLDKWITPQNAPAGSANMFAKQPVVRKAETNTTYTPPRTELEIALVKIWEEFLGITPVGIYDDFFESGGHSLLAMRLVAALKKELNITIPLKVLLRLNNIKQIVQWIETERTDDIDESAEYEIIKL